MNNQNKSKEDILNDLQELQLKYKALKVSFDLKISQHKQAEQALRESEERFSKAYLTSPIAFLIANMEDGKIIEVNDAFTTFSGYTREEALSNSTVGLKFWAVEEDRTRMLTALRNSKTVNRMETFLRTKSGNLLNVLLSAQLIQVNNNYCIISSIEDITDRKKKEADLQEREMHSQSLLRLSRNLESAQSYSEVLDAALNEVRITIGYQTLAAYFLTEDKKYLKALVAGGPISDTIMSEEGTATLKIEGDKMLEEIVTAKEIVIVEDAQTDDRVNKEIVKRYGFRTIVNIPIILFDRHLGTVSVCTLMKEGVHVPTRSEQKYLIALASHMAVSLERIRLLMQQKQSELLLKEKNDRIESQNEELGQTNRKLILAKQQSDEREEKFRLMIKNSNDSFVLINQLGEQIYISDAAARDTGFTIEELKGPIKNVVYPEDWEKVADAWKEVLSKNGEIIRVQYRHKHKNKDYIWYEAAAQNFIDHPAIKAVVVNVRDITIIKETEQELIKAKEKAEESDRLKTAFLQNMSHEIRTPMNAIMGFSDLLMKNFENKTKLQNFSEIIAKRCNDLLEIINDILDISKIESGQLPVNLEECNLIELFAELSAFFTEYQLRINKRHITLSLQALCNPGDNLIVTDKVKLKQIFINLITNAFKFTQEGSIQGGCKFDDNHNLQFFISDTGIGIPVNKQKLVFERFAQLNQDITKNLGGTGLGLPIVKGLVNLLGGEIYLHSEPGNGSSFYFTIPYKTTKHISYITNAFEKNKNKNYSETSILIVEDDAYNAEYLKEILSELNANILFANNGKSAIDISLSQSIDLVLMDIRLPDMNGYEATQQIKQLKPDMKIIAQTAYASDDEKQKALIAGCIDYISKPTKQEAILSMLYKYLK